MQAVDRVDEEGHGEEHPHDPVAEERGDSARVPPVGSHLYGQLQQGKDQLLVIYPALAQDRGQTEESGVDDEGQERPYRQGY